MILKSDAKPCKRILDQTLSQFNVDFVFVVVRERERTKKERKKNFLFEFHICLCVLYINRHSKEILKYKVFTSVLLCLRN